MAVLRHDDARERGAHLAVQRTFGACEGLGGDAEVHVVEDHRRRLPTQFQRAPRDPLAADRRDAPTGGGGPGERDLVDAGIPHEQFGDLAVRRDDVQHAGRQPDLLGHLRVHVALARCFG